MKDIIVGLADYNMNAGRRMLGILEGATDAVLSKEMGSYYKTIMGTVDHIFTAELFWLRKFDGFFPSPCLRKSWLVNADMDEAKNRAKAGSKMLFSLLRDADNLLFNFASEVDEDDLGARVKYKNLQGEEHQRKYWNLIVHILNHGTHHRGEISAMLDMQGIANDWSGFNLYTK